MERRGILLEIEGVEASLKEQLKRLKGPYNQENKEQDIIKVRLKALRAALLAAVDRVISSVEQKLDIMFDPMLQRKEEVDDIVSSLRRKKTHWQRVVSSDLEMRIEALKELGETNKKIRDLGPKEARPPVDMDEVILFSEDEIYQALMGVVKVGGVDGAYVKEELLLSEYEIIDLKSGNSMPQPKLEVPDFCACFQINRKLYYCGGSQIENSKWQCVSNFFSTDYKGDAEQLSSMNQARSCLSLSGNPTTLLAVGGWNKQALKRSESYSVIFNKWVVLPQLKKARQWPGSCVLKSGLAYCFCGYINRKSILNSIETIDLGSNNSQWQMLTMQEAVEPNYHLVALPYSGKILLFGGYHGKKNMYMFSQQGELLENLSEMDNIPGGMCIGTALVQDGRVYAVGTKLEWNWEWKAQTYDGLKWSTL